MLPCILVTLFVTTAIFALSQDHNIFIHEHGKWTSSIIQAITITPNTESIFIEAFRFSFF